MLIIIKKERKKKRAKFGKEKKNRNKIPIFNGPSWSTTTKMIILQEKKALKLDENKNF
jgi:hypothetical protein